ncbi:ATP-binding cassette domain-containing protein, partial [Gleimia europaea]|nr:ATP-binding cassette domain-containing protein [Gleimia europaea]
ITFEHVQFGYDPEKPVIHDLSLSVEPGHMVAIVGPTGAGKTTLVNLLMRFYEIDSGKIAIKGRSIADINKDDLRAGIGMVLQDTWLFEGTIAENIAYGADRDVSMEEVVAAAKKAQAHSFIRHLPQGYDTVVKAEGSNLSQGERQLLTIARAFISKPDILILDEATSSVDTRTEAVIQEAMERLRKGRTSFVIAHRLSTIRSADVILVLEDGDVVEQGSHEELLAAQGAYAKLHALQFEE